MKDPRKEHLDRMINQALDAKVKASHTIFSPNNDWGERYDEQFGDLILGVLATKDYTSRALKDANQQP